MDNSYYETCNLDPWIQEIVNRMHESTSQGKPFVDLSYEHPRGFIPQPILRRKAVREVLKGWTVRAAKSAPTPEPNNVWIGAQGKDLERCSLTPFRQEIELRERESFVADLTNHHPRGGIPKVILDRIGMHNNRKWREQMAEEIDKLQGQANRAEALSKTLLEKCDAVEDPRKLKAASKDQIKLAEQLRAQAAELQRDLNE